MTDQEAGHVTDLLAAHDALIHWCETLITAHADLVELTSEADLLNIVETDEHGRRLTQTRGVNRGAPSARRTPPRGPQLQAAARTLSSEGLMALQRVEVRMPRPKVVRLEEWEGAPVHGFPRLFFAISPPTWRRLDCGSPFTYSVRRFRLLFVGSCQSCRDSRG